LHIPLVSSFVLSSKSAEFLEYMELKPVLVVCVSG